MADTPATVARARAAFAALYGRAPEQVAWSPGRVNLIGEHTDYNDGFVLPMAIDRGIAVAFSPRRDGLLRAHSVSFGATEELSLSALARPSAGGWFRYIAAVVLAMRANGWPVGGADLAIDGDLPPGAGLSSSAALEVAVLLALCRVGGTPWDVRAAALTAQRAEHEFVGVACGIMDQLAVTAARAGSALLVDCRSLDIRDVPLPQQGTVIVFDSGVRRDLVSSAYNERRATCERAVETVKRIDPSVRALRDVDEPLLERARPSMDDVTFRRALHVVRENERPLAMAAALERADLARAGRLMLESHGSLRDLYEVSSVELDAIVGLAAAAPGCHGARLTGAGFGGCAIALVDADRSATVIRAVVDGYRQQTGRTCTALVCRASAGAHLVAHLRDGAG
jgi:galactokinase